MFCENCGSEIPNGATFCSSCGQKINFNTTPNSKSGAVKNNKNIILALFISFLLTGLGIVYAGNKKKGIILFVVGLIFFIFGRAIPLFSIMGTVIWAYALYETYNEVKIANGETNPNMIEDIKGFPTTKKVGAITVIAIIFLILIGGVIGALTPSHDTTIYDEDYDLYESSSLDSGYSSDGASYSSSSDGYETHGHYEDEHGSADIEGSVNDDGSVDAHQKGTTDYGSYEIDSHMDSDGNIHGTVDVGGRTYHVSSS